MFRSYKAFAPKYYKLAVWVFYPVLAIFCCVLVQNGFFGLVKKPGYHFMVATNIMCNCMVFVECMSDYWLFSGIQSKNANHMDLLKSSPRGRRFFRGALITDVIRRGLTIVACNAINAVIGVYAFHSNFGGVEGIGIIAARHLYLEYSTKYFLSIPAGIGIGVACVLLGSLVFWMILKKMYKYPMDKFAMQSTLKGEI